MSRLCDLWDELQTIEETISKWCMQMAWPGRCPTPPAQAWGRRREIYDELREKHGVNHPRFFWKKDRPTTGAKQCDRGEE